MLWPRTSKIDFSGFGFGIVVLDMVAAESSLRDKAVNLVLVVKILHSVIRECCMRGYPDTL